MGYTLISLSRILKDEELFKDKSILTLGTLFPYLKPSEFDLLQKYYPNKDIKSIRQVPREKFSEHLFGNLIGAKCIHSIDVSDYQESQIVCDLNKPIPKSLANSYDVIIDAGTLEHLSNFSCALENFFTILVNGGIYYFGVPCNNWIDHGFFQFSPTLFIDLCIDNANLKLLRLDFDVFDGSTSYCSQSYSIFNEQNYILKSIYNSNNRLNVSGIIQKEETGFQLSLVQSKYRNQYNTVKIHSPEVISANFEASTKPTLATRLKAISHSLASRYFNFIVMSALLPLSFKIKFFRIMPRLFGFLRHPFSSTLYMLANRNVPLGHQENK
jgi:SAM-dependent methyltransferase